MRWSIEQIPLRFRAAAAGICLYLLWPVAHAPEWQWQSLWQSEAETATALAPLLSFYTKYGEQALPALQAQLELNKLRDMELALIADNAEFSAQSRDDSWAEATEFMIAHVAQTVGANELRIYDSECRNNLCRIELAAPKGLNPDFRALVLKYAATLKAGDLEFHDLKESKDRIMLELKSDKRLQYGFFAERALKPAEREQWLAEVKAWLGTQQNNKK
ncbi:hypothetical protein [Rheinheimera tilapiae]|uniref:Uncharacterized protein n=1 Tax=Rheinheimera tilapiae TaxID=875043 RepID=A0ABV6BB89_9GAMM